MFLLDYIGTLKDSTGLGGLYGQMQTLYNPKWMALIDKSWLKSTVKVQNLEKCSFFKIYYRKGGTNDKRKDIDTDRQTIKEPHSQDYPCNRCTMCMKGTIV